MLDQVLSFIKTERLCCDFFTFNIHVTENEALMSVTGPDWAKDFLKQEIDL